MKAISIRIDEGLGREFDALCRERGCKKNTLLVRLIDAFVKHNRGQFARRSKTKKDPFAAVIGLMNVQPMLTKVDDIDTVVYNV